MERINVDAATAAAMRIAQPGAELIEHDGNPVGVFVPMHFSNEFQLFIAERYARAFSEVTVEELRAADARGGDIPHDEVLRRLGL